MSLPKELPAEILKLLLQVAWADGEVQEEERILIERLGQRWGVAQEMMTELLERLAQGEPLPPPNLKLLREHPEAARRAAKSLVEVDGVSSEDEQEMLAQLELMLKA